MNARSWRAVTQVDSIVRPPEDVYYRELAGSYARVRRFLPHLLRIVRFDATPAGQSILEALNYLAEVEQGTANAPDPPVTIVNRGWRRYVGTGEDFDRKAYVFCCLDRVHSCPFSGVISRIAVSVGVRYLMDIRRDPADSFITGCSTLCQVLNSFLGRPLVRPVRLEEV